MNMMPFLFHDDVDILEYVSYHDKSGKVSDTEFFFYVKTSPGVLCLVLNSLVLMLLSTQPCTSPF